MQKISDAVQQAADLQKKIRILFVVFVLLVLTAVICMYFEWPAFYGVTAAAVLFYLFFLRRLIKKYASDFTDHRIRFGLCRPFSETELSEKPFWREETMEAWGMMPVRRTAGSLLCRHSFKAKWRGMELKCAEITFHYPAGESGGKKDFRFLSGTVLAARTREEPGRDLLILPSGLLDRTAQDAFLKEQKYTEISTEISTEFFGKNSGKDSAEDGKAAERFRVYRRGDAAPADEKTEQIRRQLKKIGAAAVIRLMPGELIVYLDKRFYSQGVVRPRVAVTKEMLLSNPLPERDAVLHLFEILE